jgi:DNA repair protein RadC
MEAIKSSRRPLTHAIPVYEVRLVQSRRPLRLAEECIADGATSARVLHAFIGLTDRDHVVAIGGQHRISDVDVRVILRAALAACSSALILGHCHPSGDPTPSPEDLTTTAKIMRACDVLGIPVLDHVIVTRDPGRYHSMVDRGTLPRP